MAQSHTIDDDPEEFDEYLYREESAGFADTVEWLFGTVFYFLLLLVSPWRWFGSQPDGIDMLEGQSETLDREPAKPPLLWRLLDFSESATTQTGFGFSYVFDHVEMFFGRAFELLAFLLRPWRWFRRAPKRPMDQNF